jgi:hypothetical protein
MRKLLAGVAGVTAILVLLVWGCLASVGLGPPSPKSSGAATMTLLVVTVSAVIWFGFAWGWGRPLITSLACIVLSFGGLVVLAVADLLTALVCERGRTDARANPTIPGGRFEEYRVGPCVFYNPEGRLPGGGD